MLGFWAGLATSFAGMTISTLAGYWLGRIGGRPVAERLIKPSGVDRLERMRGFAGEWIVVAARPVPVLAEASTKKAAFLREALIAAKLEHGQVLATAVARTADLDDLPPVAVLATRAMGGWERIVPKLIPRLAPGGVVLVWAGSDVTAILARTAWSRLRVEESRSLPGRDRSSVYKLVRI